MEGMADVTEDFIASAALNESLCFGRAWPLPRLSVSHPNEVDRYEAVVVGAGPSGLLLTVELARLGVTSLLCIDAKDEGTKAGHADGVFARSLEILRTLGLEGELLREGNSFSEFAFWGQSETDPSRTERRMGMPFFHNEARFDQLKTMHQGRIERIFKTDLEKYSKRGVQYSTTIRKVWLDDSEQSEYPIVAVLEHGGSTHMIRSKYLIGADGAHSVVRKSMQIEMEGDITDRVWGVIDFIADSDFPDLRRPTNFEGTGDGRGDGLLIPRERLSDGTYTTRLYIDMTEYDPIEGLSNGVGKASLQNAASSKKALKQKRAEITATAILKEAQK